MSMNYDNYMNMSLVLAEKSSVGSLKVGAVLVSNDDKIICSSWNGEKENCSWNAILASKIKSLGIDNASILCVTISTYDKTLKRFGLEDIQDLVQIDTIFIGLPDPAMTSYIENDPMLNYDIIKRYPDELQQKILRQNFEYYDTSPQAISNSPYYHDNRISNLVIEKLEQRGFRISKGELNLHKSRNALKEYISNHFGLEYVQAEMLVNEAISEAFNKKYGTYQYSNDTRSLDAEWKQKFEEFFYMTVNRKIEDNTIIDVGVGGGHEATSLFLGCDNITFVDVAIDGLLQVQNRIPSARIVNASADNLDVVESDCYDVYISLRTYNSSFFDIAKAVTEAKRILKNNASIIISVANGFLCSERGCIIPGLLIPGTEFVDIYRGMDTTKMIKKEYIHAGFKDIRLCPTNTEIYLSAIAA